MATKQRKLMQYSANVKRLPKFIFLTEKFTQLSRMIFIHENASMKSIRTFHTMHTFQTNSEHNFLHIHFVRKKGKHRSRKNLTLSNLSEINMWPCSIQYIGLGPKITCVRLKVIYVQ